MIRPVALERCAWIFAFVLASFFAIVRFPAPAEAQYCCIPQSFGSECAPADQGMSYTNESDCLANNTLGITRDPNSTLADPIYYPGTAFDLNRDQCNYFCGLQHTFYYCVNRNRSIDDQGGPACLQTGTADPRFTTEVVAQERGYLEQSSCVQSCPANDCSSCARVNEIMDRQIPAHDPEERERFCNLYAPNCVPKLPEENGTDRISCEQAPSCSQQIVTCCDMSDPNRFQLLVTRLGTPDQPLSSLPEGAVWAASPTQVLSCLQVNVTGDQQVLPAGNPAILTDMNLLQQRVDACKPLYGACCWKNPSAGQPSAPAGKNTFVAEVHGAGEPNAIDAVTSVYPNMQYIPNFSQRADPPTDIFGRCLKDASDDATRADAWWQQAPGTLNTQVDLDFLATFADQCQATNNGTCNACWTCNGNAGSCDRDLCVQNTKCYYDPSSERSPCRPSMDRAICPTRGSCGQNCANFQTSAGCTANPGDPQNDCEWMGPTTDNPFGMCRPNPRCYATSSSSSSSSREFQYCEREPGRRMNPVEPPDGTDTHVAGECGLYNPDVPAQRRDLATNTIVFKTDNASRNQCSNLCYGLPDIVAACDVSTHQCISPATSGQCDVARMPWFHITDLTTGRPSTACSDICPQL